MTKPMTVSEAVEVCKVWATVSRSRLNLLPSHHGKKEAEEITTALTTLEGVRLCDEGEAREIVKRLITIHVSTPQQIEDENDARRWLAEHGGE